MSAASRPKRPRNMLVVVLAIGLMVLVAGCTVTTTNNSGSCDAQGGSNAVSCAQPSTATGSPALADSPGPVSSAPPDGSSAATAAAAGSSAPTSQYLSDLDSIANSGWLLTGTPEVNGQYYPNSVVQYFAGPGTDTVSYNLGRQWQTLDMTLGLSDKSAENAPVEFQVVADGRTIYTGRFALGQSKHVRLSVAHVLRLHLASTLLSDNYNGVYADWCGAELLS